MRKHVLRVITHWALLAHIYVSMAGFTLALLFGVTGLTLNHQDFGLSEPQITKSEVSLDTELVKGDDPTALEKCVRQTLGLQWPSTDYHADPDQIQITFAAAGGRTLVTIDRATGKADVEKETRGFMGKLGDLHKGFDTGKVWYWTIDVAAALLIVSSLTGIITLVALRARRRTGFAICALSVLSVLAIYVIYVPK
jgi:uncharacterized protein